MSYFSILIVFAISSSAGAYLPVEDEAYHILYRLEAEGVLKSSLLGTRPLSRKEIIRLIGEAEENSKDRGAEDRASEVLGLINALKEKFRDDMGRRFLKPDYLSGRYIYTDKESRALNYNENGDLYSGGLNSGGSNFRLAFLGRLEYKSLAMSLNPELRNSENDTDVVLKRGYGLLSLSSFDLIFGKDALWWGPGYHGAILFSSNPKPITMAILTNPEPLHLPWVLKYLGPFRFSLFTGRLEENRDVPHPYLWGLRLDFKPVSYVELGLQRTALLGGRGRSENAEAWWQSVSGMTENTTNAEAGDQRAGGDIKITMPFKRQPVQLYLEAAGEDEAGMLPAKKAYLGGIYLPRILGLYSVDMRAEYATTHVKGAPDVWYNHHIYSSGYTYKGWVIGHHMGTDSEDMFLELGYYLPDEAGRIYVSFDWERHNLSSAVKAVKTETAAGMRLNLRRHTGVEAGYKRGVLKDFNSAGSRENINLFSAGINYYF